MSFGQYRILALTLPTVAALTVISILWFRHHQKKRRPRVDLVESKEIKHSLENYRDHPDSESEDLDVCMSAKAARQSTTVCHPVEDRSEEIQVVDFGPKAAEPLMKDIKDYIVQSVDTVSRDKLEACLVEKPAEEVCKTLKIADSLQNHTDMQKEANILYQNSEKKRNRKSLEDLDSDLEEGEIRSPNESFSNQSSEGSVSKQDSEDRDSVFADDSEDSSVKERKRVLMVHSEDTESDLEEGEIRSTDGRSEETMEKEKEELTEKLASLKLDQMKVSADPKDLPSLELDQMKLDDAKSVSERDSANHSPSEVMLASPSISNFSDAHSEGSSDSGKGQSEAATSPSPSRTPAGGSSLAGDHAPSVYEFVLPQVIVGRLIGRHGTFLHEIKTQTHTNIFIKRHPDSNKLKICAIEGTQQDIDKALAKIRHKFPLRRFPQLTLEKVSFIQVNPPPLKSEDFHLALIEGVNNDVVLSSLISAAHFFLQQPCHPSYGSLAALNTIMSQLYSSGEAPVLETPINYAICAAPAMGGWYRAQIVHVEEDGLACTVRYLDYGGYSRIPSSNLRQIRGDLLVLPFQAVECYLANVAPPPGEDDWSEEARLFVQNLTCGQVLQAQVYDYAEDGAPLVYLYSKFANQVVLINEELVHHGYAVIAEPGSSCGTASEDGGRTDDEGGRTDITCVRSGNEVTV